MLWKKVPSCGRCCLQQRRLVKRLLVWQCGFVLLSKKSIVHYIFNITDILSSITKKELEKLKGKGLVETRELLEAGLASGAFTHEDVVLVDETWNRVERPPTDIQEPFALIFWEPTSPKDQDPSDDKVVSDHTVCFYFASDNVGSLVDVFIMEGSLVRSSPRNRNTWQPKFMSSWLTAFGMDLITSSQKVIMNDHCRHNAALERGGSKWSDSESMTKLPSGTIEAGGTIQYAPMAKDAYKPNNIISHTQFRLAFDE